MTNHPQRSRARQVRINRECERWLPILKPLSGYEAAERILHKITSGDFYGDLEGCREMLASALLAVAALAQPDDGWQPIATAPRSREEEDEDVWILTCRPPGKLPMLTTWDHDRACWCTFNLAWEGNTLRPPWEPTHWRRVPEPPAA